jgi:hypothetical protein
MRLWRALLTFLALVCPLAGQAQNSIVVQLDAKEKQLENLYAEYFVQSEPEKAEISIAEADDLYREIRVENVFTDENGEKASLKPGAKVDVVVEADSNATVKKPQNS